MSEETAVVFHRVGAAEEIAEGKGKPFRIGETRVAVFRYGGELFATDELCTHADASLAFGPVKDGCVLCPWHYAEFDLATGAAKSCPPSRT